jgi:hypothetical protein
LRTDDLPDDQINHTTRTLEGTGSGRRRQSKLDRAGPMIVHGAILGSWVARLLPGV